MKSPVLSLFGKIFYNRCGLLIFFITFADAVSAVQWQDAIWNSKK